MAKTAVQYACSECGYAAGRWFGKCPACGEFGTLVEEAKADSRTTASARPPMRLVDVRTRRAVHIESHFTLLNEIGGGRVCPARHIAPRVVNLLLD